MWLYFWQLLEKIGPLFIPTSGHTVPEIHFGGGLGSKSPTKNLAPNTLKKRKKWKSNFVFFEIGDKLLSFLLTSFCVKSFYNHLPPTTTTASHNAIKGLPWTLRD